jgi:hypothetical protein
MTADADREIYFEFTAVGAVVKVAAVDAQTGLEVTIMGPAGASRTDLQRLAAQKLKARLAKGSDPPLAG